METTNSGYGKLKTFDFWKGLIVAGFGSAVTTIMTAISMITDYGTFEFKTLLYAFCIGAIGGLSGYLSKNAFSNSEGVPFAKESDISKNSDTIKE